MIGNKHISPWIWVPTLYFTEGIPYFLVNSISVMLFAKMAVPNDQLAFFTTLLYFPWFLKGLWSPFVDIILHLLQHYFNQFCPEFPRPGLICHGFDDLTYYIVGK